MKENTQIRTSEQTVATKQILNLLLNTYQKENTQIRTSADKANTQFAAKYQRKYTNTKENTQIPKKILKYQSKYSNQKIRATSANKANTKCVA